MADLLFRVVTPRRATPGWFRRWLLAPPPGPTIGRKRRARRARGRRIEARRNRPYVGGRIWLARATFARVRAGGAPLPRVMMLDEVDSFDCGLTKEQARAEIAAETERWRKLIDPSLGVPWEGADEAHPNRR